MSVQEVMRLLPLIEGAVPGAQGPALMRLHALRRANPGVVRAAARQMGAASVDRAAIGAGGWANWVGGQASQPRAILRPATIGELQGALQQAVDQGLRCKPIASGHSTSSVSRPDDGALAIDLGRMDKLMKRQWEKDVLPARATAGGSTLVRIQAGATVRSASIALAEQGLAFANTGSFDGQQLAGALCTGTHGSGVAFGPLAEIVESVDLLAVIDQPNGRRVRLLRIEPADGITDPAKYKRGPLIQDDDVFRAAVIGIGALGIVVAMTIRVVPRFWVAETRTPKPWSWIGPRLATIARSADHVDIHINPYEKGGDHAAVIIRRNRIPFVDDTPPTRPESQEFVRVIAKLFGTDLLGWFASNFPAVVADGIQRYCDEGGSFTSASYKVLITGYGYDIEATSAEYATSLAEGGAMVDTVLGLARAHRAAPRPTRFCHSSPLGLRFVRGSTQRLAQHRDPVNATLEIPFVLGSRNIELALSTYEAALPNARPHWGQVTSIDGTRAAALYGADWAAWRAVYDRFNASGAFSNRFTDQLGL